MKLSICLTVALTALSVAAVPSLGLPVQLQERWTADDAREAIVPKPLHVNAASRKPSRNPSWTMDGVRNAMKPKFSHGNAAPRKAVEHRNIRFQERGSFGAAAGLFKAAAKVAHHAPKPHGKPAPRKPSHPAPHKPSRLPTHRPPVRLPKQVRPAPRPKSKPAPPPSSGDAFSGLDGMFNAAASQNEPHFDVGSLLRRNKENYNPW